mmetsp:Transcript_54598/g.153307  ORF Transcript_54598/g.153307 Transcript_54598/m.153307 type:complete len:277 (-) Transcript_54598:144-974(-)
MIYILRAPCDLCDCVARQLASGCGILSKFALDHAQWLEGGCGQVAVVLGKLSERLRGLVNVSGPLGGFVLLTMIMNMPSVIYAVMAVADPSVEACGGPRLQHFCKVDIALALINLVFAFYIKQRVDEGLARRLGGTPSGGEPFLPTQAPATRSNRRLVLKEVKTLLLYDVGFAVYFFVFVYAFATNVHGLSLARYCYGESDAPHAAALLQIFYAVLAVQYAVCWSCIQMGAAQLESCFPSGPWSWRPRRRPHPAAAQQPVYVCGPVPAPSAPPLPA